MNTTQPISHKIKYEHLPKWVKRELRRKTAKETGHVSSTKPFQKVTRKHSLKIRKLVTDVYHKINDVFHQFKSKFRSVISKINNRAIPENGGCQLKTYQSSESPNTGKKPTTQGSKRKRS